MKKKYFTLLFLLPVILLQAQSWHTKVHESVFKDISEKNKSNIIIYLKLQADLSGADILESKEEKGEFVFQKLIQTATISQGRIITYLQNKNTAFQNFWIVNCISLKADMPLIETLAGFDEVEKIVKNPTTHTALNDIENDNFKHLNLKSEICLPPDTVVKSWGYARIKADSVWAMGFRGQGVVVGGEDTGIEWTHPALIKKYRGYNNGGIPIHDYNWHDAIHPDTTKNPCGYDTQAPCDDNNHGSHTMGSMVGGTIGINKDTIIIGVAPDAQWVGARNMDQGNGTLASYVECFQFFLAPTNLKNQLPDPKKAPHVVNNSWYCAVSEGCNASNFNVLENAMNALRSSGVVVVVSNGNEGRQGCASTNGPPAFFKKAFSVGATAITDTIADFSSRGAVTIDGSNRLKPNVSAPGVGILSSIKGSNYAIFSGTSMAGPHIVGVVALMISANPKLAGQVDTIESIIEATTLQLKTNENCGGLSGQNIPNNTYGYGRVDALAAVKKAILYKTTAVQEIKPASVNVFPNPFTNEINIKTENILGDATVQIFNATGQLMFSQKNNFTLQPLFSVLLPKAASGLYFYRIENEKSSLTGKIIKSY